MSLNIKRHTWANRCLLAVFLKNLGAIKERPGRAVKVRRRGYTSLIQRMSSQRLYECPAFIKIQLMFPDQTSENLQQVSIMEKRAEFPASLHQPPRIYLFFIEKLHCWQTGMYFQRMKLLPSSKVFLTSNGDQLLVCMSLVTFISSAIWFSDQHFYPLYKVSQTGRPGRHTSAHHQAPLLPHAPPAWLPLSRPGLFWTSAPL